MCSIHQRLHSISLLNGRRLIEKNPVLLESRLFSFVHPHQTKQGWERMFFSQNIYTLVYMHSAQLVDYLIKTHFYKENFCSKLCQVLFWSILQKCPAEKPHSFALWLRVYLCLSPYTPAQNAFSEHFCSWTICKKQRIAFDPLVSNCKIGVLLYSHLFQVMAAE